MRKHKKNTFFYNFINSVITIFNKENIVAKKIKQRDFFLKYQPICNSKGKLVGVEALIRWGNENTLPITPSLLIEQAIKSKTIIPLTRHIIQLIHEDFSLLSSNQKFYISLNIELDHINDKEFVSDMIFLKNKLSENHELVVELSERSFIENQESIILKLNELRSMGIRIALDDFGSGFSALANLDVIPLDIVKLDTAFINKQPENTKTSILIKSIHHMCKSLGFEIIAEGVSSEEKLNFLTNHGIVNTQGYHHSKPLKIKELYEYIECKENTRL
ncbi:EAL domain-containing protein [Klebsiella pneumoniae]|nr:EAL domain-containing protein [Klebsiella pneumoniae]MTW92446.1 EAL domain-containing protein [Klebsiella pneumoniae]